MIGATGKISRIHFQGFIHQELYSGLIGTKWTNSNRGAISEAELLDKYFDLLSNAEIKKLYEIYKVDFQQFGYTFEFRGIKYNDKAL